MSLSRIAPTLICSLVILGLALVVFGPVLVGGEQFAFRDSAHYYYPLHLRVQQEWQAGRVPLWEPEENAGTPLLGNPTAAVLYPGKVVFAVFAYPWAARIYVVAHVLLALLGMLAFCRSLGVGWVGATLGGVSYAFCAPVLFQYCNVVYLVGAGWAPLGLRAADRWLRKGVRWGLVELAIVLALQTLGGDPESAYLIGMCSVGYAGMLCWSRFKNHATPQKEGHPLRSIVVLCVLLLGWVGGVLGLAAWIPSGWRWVRKQTAIEVPPGGPKSDFPFGESAMAGFWLILACVLFVIWFKARAHVRFGKSLIGLALAVVLAFGLTAAETLPVLEFLSLSTRSAPDAPHQIFGYSLEPYRLVEMIWPRFFGLATGENRHWLSLIPPVRDHQYWTLSLYGGSLTLILALGSLGWRGGPAWRGWLTAIAIASLLASFGKFGGPLWWARLIGEDAPWGPLDRLQTPYRIDHGLRDHTGSVYWILAAIWPGFRRFRYPSKLLMFTCLSISALAACGWDRVRLGQGLRVNRSAWILLIPTAIGLGLVLALRTPIIAGFSARAVGGRSTFGPFDASRAYGDLCRSLVHATICLAMAIALIKLAKNRPVAAGLAAILLLCADLATANRELVVTIPQKVFEKPSPILLAIEAAERLDPSPGPYRIHRLAQWTPPQWEASASNSRNREVVTWARDTLEPKYGITNQLSYTYTIGAAEVYDYVFFFAPFLCPIGEPQARLLERLTGQLPEIAEVTYIPRRSLDLWNARYLIAPVDARGWSDEQRGYASLLLSTERVYPKEGFSIDDAGVIDAQVFRNTSVYPRAWLVHDARFPRPIVGLERNDRQDLMREILFQNDQIWNIADLRVFDPRTLVWIETDNPRSLARFATGGPPSPQESVSITKLEPQRVELTATLDKPGFVVLADLFYPGWRLAIDGKPKPILRANRMMRGAAVEKGTHHLMLTYEPQWFRYGCMISCGGFGVLALLSLWAMRRGRASSAGFGLDDTL